MENLSPVHSESVSTYTSYSPISQEVADGEKGGTDEEESKGVEGEMTKWSVQ